jgi:hypothetical protein
MRWCTIFSSTMFSPLYFLARIAEHHLNVSGSDLAIAMLSIGQLSLVEAELTGATMRVVFPSMQGSDRKVSLLLCQGCAIDINFDFASISNFCFTIVLFSPLHC